MAIGPEELRRLVVGAVRESGTVPERGATAEELDELMLRLGRPLPDSLARWLSVCRGEAIGAGGVFGCRPDLPFLDIVHCLALFPEWEAKSWIPVASDGCGNCYVLTAEGSVGFVDMMEAMEQLQGIEAGDLFAFLSEYLGRDQVR